MGGGAVEVKLQNGVPGRGTGMCALREDRAGGTSPKYGGREEGRRAFLHGTLGLPE